MSGSTTELNLKTAVDSDDTADYLTLSLASSLQTIDALYNNTTGHTHSGAHQGGPIGSIPATAIPDGSITSAKIADATIVAADVALNGITQGWISKGLNSNPTTTSSAYVDLDGDGSSNQLRVDFTSKGGDLLVWLDATTSNSLATALNGIALTLDGAAEVAEVVTNFGGVGYVAQMSTAWLFTGVSAGAHFIKGRWYTNSGTATASQIRRRLLILERIR
jgi:hypothetical protein